MFNLSNGLALVMTRLLILATVVVWIVYDFYVYSSSGNPSTISAVIWQWSWHIPGIPFAFGVLIGHLLFQMQEAKTWPDETPTGGIK